MALHRQNIDRRPLRDGERDLIRAVERQPWTPELREALTRALRGRGFSVSPYCSFDYMAVLLEDCVR